MYYLNYFFIMSILGHIIECFFYSNGESGILLGSWTPIYGFGTIIILFINKFLDKYKLKKITKIFLLFILSAVILSMLEVIGGYIIRFIFNTEIWDYTNHRFNIGKYTSFEMSLVWGLSSILLIYFIKPILDKIISKTPNYLTYIFICLFVFDLISTIKVKIF